MVAPEPVNDTVWSGAEFENVVPVKVIPDPAVYSVLLSVLLIVKFGYVPLTLVAPEPVSDTV